MFRPFKTLESKWNAHTPVFLHNRTKENIIFQLTLAVLICLGLAAKDEWELRKLKKSTKSNTEDYIVHLHR